MQLLGGIDRQHLVKRIACLMGALKHVLLKAPNGALRSVTLNHYAAVLLHFCQQRGAPRRRPRAPRGAHHAEASGATLMLRSISVATGVPRPASMPDASHPVPCERGAC